MKQPYQTLLSLTVIFWLLLKAGGFNARAQQIETDTLFYSSGVRVSTPDSADLFKILVYYDSAHQKAFERIYTIDGFPIEETHYSNIFRNEIDLYHREFFENHKTHRYIGYQKGKLHGKFLVYYPSGIKKREDFYSEGLFTKGTCYDEQGNEIQYRRYNSQASFIDGEIAFHERVQLEMSRTMKNAGDKLGFNNIALAPLGGKAWVRFTIDKEGVMKNVRVLKSPSADINDRIVNAIIRIRGWNPATIEGEYVDSEVTLSIDIFMN